MNWADLKYTLDIQYPLNNFNEYSLHIENSLRMEVSKYEEMAEGLNEEESERFWDFYIDEANLYHKEFPNILRSSLFISMYSFLEKMLVSLCVPDSTGKTFKDIKGNKSIIDKAKEYLTDVLQKDFPSESPAWEFVLKVRLVRNCLVHCGGVVTELSREKEQKDIRRIVSVMEHVDIDEHDNIQLDSEICNEFSDHLFNLFSILYQREITQ